MCPYLAQCYIGEQWAGLSCWLSLWPWWLYNRRVTEESLRAPAPAIPVPPLGTFSRLNRIRARLKQPNAAEVSHTPTTLATEPCRAEPSQLDIWDIKGMTHGLVAFWIRSSSSGSDICHKTLQTSSKWPRLRFKHAYCYKCTHTYTHSELAKQSGYW